MNAYKMILLGICMLIGGIAVELAMRDLPPLSPVIRVRPEAAVYVANNDPSMELRYQWDVGVYGDNHSAYLDLSVRITEEILEAIYSVKGINWVDKWGEYRMIVAKSRVFDWEEIGPLVILAIQAELRNSGMRKIS